MKHVGSFGKNLLTRPFWLASNGKSPMFTKSLHKFLGVKCFCHGSVGLHETLIFLGLNRLTYKELKSSNPALWTCNPQHDIAMKVWILRTKPSISVYDQLQNWAASCWNLPKSLKMGCMHQGPRVQQCPIAIQFLATYVIVMGVSNRDEASLWTCSSWIYKNPHLRVWILKFWSKLQTEAFKGYHALFH